LRPSIQDGLFFSTPDRETPRGRLLLLSQHFPPGQAAGARRWEKLSHFAARRGFGLDVVTLAPGDLPSRDDRRLEGLPDAVCVFGVAARTHWLSRVADRVWAGLRSWRRASGASGKGASNAASPTVASSEWLRREDVIRLGYGPSVWMSSIRAIVELANEAAWADAAAGAAQAIIDPNRHRAIISCGPPHMIHRAARRLSQRTGLPFVVDLRDPWSRNERLLWSLATPLWYDVAERIEARTFARASLVVMNTPAARQVMSRAYPELASKIIAVTNGFDEEAIPTVSRDEAFVISFAGSIYLDRSPRHLFQAVAQVSKALALDRSKLRIELMGHYDVDAIRKMSREEGVEEQVDLLPPGNVRDVAALLARSAMLVNLPQDSDLAIPSKIFEYMIFPAWILALAVPESATGQILQGTDAHVVRPEDVAGMTEVIRDCFLAHRRGVQPQPVARDPRLGRSHQASLFFDALERCLEDTSRASAAPRLETSSACSQ
jgi:glycosyltransferase involved in cell wall biosynthesis